MKYLITGGAGFIGSHLADALVARDEEVIILDNLSTGRRENIEHLVSGFHPRVKLAKGSILDAGLVHGLICQVDAVIHLAAVVGVQLIVQRPLDTLLTNVRGTEMVLEAAAKCDTKVIVVSTSEIYGKNAAGPLEEDADRILGSPFKARWAYSTSKAVDEIFAYNYWRDKGVRTIVTRLFNCAGPRQTGAYGMVIPRFVDQALAGEDLTVYGDGTQSRCFCHVADTVDAFIRLLECDQAIGDVFNVGALNETTITDLANLVIDRTDSRSGVRFIPYSEAYEPGFEDMERRLPDITKINRVTGWSPTRTLEDIINDVIKDKA